MIENIATSLIIISLLTILALIAWYIFVEYKHHTWVQQTLKLYDSEILADDLNSKTIALKLKLIQAGLSKKQFNEIIFVSALAGISIFYFSFIVETSSIMKIFAAIIGIAITILTPTLFLEEQKKARVKRIDKDLAIFIDLMIIILEGGGGLNNAIDEVTIEGKDVLGKDLLNESKQFKYEFVTYGSDIAYKNLIKRSASDAVGTIVGFMKLSEETGIGVKTIFENQSQEIKSNDILEVEKRAATMNISLTFTMFIFILPAVIAMMAFPMMADALMPKF